MISNIFVCMRLLLISVKLISLFRRCRGVIFPSQCLSVVFSLSIAMYDGVLSLETTSNCVENIGQFLLYFIGTSPE
jgi:hypothetical protein